MDWGKQASETLCDEGRETEYKKSGEPEATILT